MLEKRAKTLRDIFDLASIGASMVRCSNCRISCCGIRCSRKIYDTLTAMFGFESEICDEYFKLRAEDEYEYIDDDLSKKKAEFLIKCIVSNAWRSVNCDKCLLHNHPNCADIGKGCHLAMANSLRDMYGLPRTGRLIIRDYTYDYLETLYK